MNPDSARRSDEVVPSIAIELLRVIREVTGRAQVPALHEPVFAGNEWAYVKDCLDTTMVSSVGRYVDRFEAGLAEYTGVKHAVAVVNGTAALHVCLLLAGVRVDDEVMIPALTFVATANAVAYCGAVPHLADAGFRTLGMDPVALRDYLKAETQSAAGECRNRKTGRRIKALVPMHTFGHPVDLDALQELCDEFRITLIEDAAEALGSYYKGRHVGGRGLLSALSFNGNKIVTTGGGGAILTNDSALAAKAKHLTTTAKLPHPWRFFHDQIGFNYRLPNLNAALGCAQLERMPAFLDAKRRLAEKYQGAFSNLAGLRFFREPDFARSNYWLNAVLLEDGQARHRDAILNHAHSQGMALRPAWVGMQHLPAYSTCPQMPLPAAESIEARLINLPSGAGLVTDG